jgi:bifunctional DNA-binding transcriptional regulator/antitoxin component of YhaV-PrlF toxin-antitoxin module
MRIKDIWGEPKFFGSATVGPRGQMVIPVNARKELGIDTGTTLLLFTGPQSRMLVLLPADIMEHMLGRMGERLAHLEKLVRDYKSKAAAKEKGD